MALTNTTLAAAVAVNDTSIKVTATTGFADKQMIRVDNEWMAQAGAAAGPGRPRAARPRRLGADRARHPRRTSSRASRATGPTLPPGSAVSVSLDPGRITIGVDTTFATADYPAGDTTYVITKAGVCAITLGDPSKAQNGLRLTFRSATANAHTVTYTAGFSAGRPPPTSRPLRRASAQSSRSKRTRGTLGRDRAGRRHGRVTGGRMDTDLGLTDRDKELKKWNTPYRYQEFPKALFRAATTTAREGRDRATRVVTSEGEERLRRAPAGCASPQLALERGDRASRKPRHGGGANAPGTTAG